MWKFRAKNNISKLLFSMVPYGHAFCMFYTVCPRTSDPFDILSYYIKWVITSWTYSTCLCYIITVDFQGSLLICMFVYFSNPALTHVRPPALSPVQLFTFILHSLKLPNQCFISTLLMGNHSITISDHFLLQPQH